MLRLSYSFGNKYLASQGIINLCNNVKCLAVRHQSKNNAKQNELHYFNFEDDEKDEETKAKTEAEIMRMQNKSKLLPHHYDTIHDKISYKPNTEYHSSLKFRRRIYGRYGKESGVNPSILWPSKIELEAMKEFEAIAQPDSFHKLVKKVKEKNEENNRIQEEMEKMILEKVKLVKKTFYGKYYIFFRF